MAKRAARRAKLHAIDSDRAHSDRVHSLVFDRTPLANDRDQSYVRKVRPRSDNQRRLMEAIESKPLTIAVGPAGTGKTYLAISAAVEALEAGTVSRIVLSRPAVEAGENLGFLPGDMREKLDPYLRPLWDALNDAWAPNACAQPSTTAPSRSPRSPSCAAAPSTTASC
jgi:phosphate starvation-inducible PhoH-like protein